MVIFSGIATAASALLFGGSALATALITGGLQVAASTALSYFTRQKTKGPVAQAPTVAISSRVLFGANTKDWVVVGRYALKGQRLYSASWGEGDQYKADVLKLSRGWCDGLEPEIIMFGERRTLTSATPIGDEDERWIVDGSNGKLSIRFYSGKPGQVVDARLVSATASSDRPWLSTARATNTCYVIFESDYDAEVLERRWPEVKFVLRGLRLYDWRKDSTVNGGSGTHRVDDPTTWAWTENPPVIRANVEIGFKGVLSGRTIIGMAKTMGMLDVESYTISANVCDTDRVKNGRTFKTYTMGMAIESGQDAVEVLKDCDDAMAGYALNIAGLSGVMAGAPQLPVAEILPADIRMDGKVSSRLDRKAKDTYNHLTGSFMSPESLWNLEPLDPVTSAADLAHDKVDRSTNFDFPQINDVDCAQYNITVRYWQVRLGGQHSLPISQRLGLTIEVGRWYTYAGESWMAMACDPEDRGYRLQLSRVSADTYDEETIPAGPIIVPPSAVTRPAVGPVSGFGISAFIEQDANAGGGIPVIELEWTSAANVRIDWITVQYREVGTTVAEERQFTDVAAGSAYLRGLAGSTQYEARAAYVYDGFKQTTWTHIDAGPWARVTTGVPVGAPPPDNSVNFSKLGLDTQSIIANLERSSSSNEVIAAATAASGSLEMLNRYNEDGQIKALVSNLGDSTEALVATETIARTSAIEALASQALLVQAALGEATTSGLMKVESSVSGDGLTTSFSFFARADTGDDFEEAGMIIEVVSDGGDPATLTSRVAFAADKLVFDNGSQPFTITNDGVFLKDMFFERLRSSPSITTHEIDINANSGTIRVSTAP